MIAVNVDRLYAGYGELKAVYGALSELSETISEIGTQLSRRAGMEQSGALLRKAECSIGRNMEQCRLLCQSIDVICQSYARCEERVSDLGESAVIHYPHLPAELVDLSAALDVLHEFSFYDEGGLLP